MAKKAKTPKLFGKTPMNRPDVWIVDLVERFGIVNSLLVVYIYIFVANASLEQKREFIDKYVLFKTPKNGSTYIFFLLLCLYAIHSFKVRHYKKRLNIEQENLKKANEKFDNAVNNLK